MADVRRCNQHRAPWLADLILSPQELLGPSRCQISRSVSERWVGGRRRVQKNMIVSVRPSLARHARVPDALLFF